MLLLMNYVEGSDFSGSNFRFKENPWKLGKKIREIMYYAS